MPDQTQTPGGQGDDAPPKRSEMKLVEHALRQDWPIPTAVKRRILQRLINFVDVDPDDEAMRADSADESPIVPPAQEPAPRTVIAASRVIAAFCGLSLKQQALDLAREKFAGKEDEFDLSQAVGKAEQLALERKAERERERTPDQPAG